MRNNGGNSSQIKNRKLRALAVVISALSFTIFWPAKSIVAAENIIKEYLQEIPEITNGPTLADFNCFIENPDGGKGCNPFTISGNINNPPMDGPTEFGQLTRYWAQTNAGVDLAWDFIAEHEKNSGPLPRVHVGAYDDGFEPTALPKGRATPYLQKCSSQRDCPELGSPASWIDHGIGVVNIMAGPKPIGGSSLTVISAAFAEVPFDPSKKPPLSETFAAIAKVEPKPLFVNMSKAIGSTSERGFLSGLEKLSNQSIITFASGNWYPVVVQVEEIKERGFYVGSIAPNGLISDFSQKSPWPNMLNTPSDYFGTSIDKHGNFMAFGGTSGAAPLANGILANLEAFLPGITREEMKEIAIMTQYQSSGFHQDISGNGGGTMNAYQLVRVAARIRARGWPKSREEIFKSQTYDFAAEADELLAKAKTFGRYGSCSDQEKSLSLLRKSFFLNPKNQIVRDELFKRYSEAGFTAEAHYYRGSRGEAILADMKPSWRKFILALRNRLPYESFLSSFDELNDQDKMMVEFRISGLGEEAFPMLAHMLSKAPNEEARKRIYDGYFWTKDSVLGLNRTEAELANLKAAFERFLNSHHE